MEERVQLQVFIEGNENHPGFPGGRAKELLSYYDRIKKGDHVTSYYSKG